tara:strand:+ start:239 stop:478 length:240 start_codon:yes stop_codon:yes gene_type:complete
MRDWEFCTVIVDTKEVVYSVQPKEVFLVNSGDSPPKNDVFDALESDGWEISDTHTKLTQKESIVGGDFTTFIFRRRNNQ